MSLIPPDVSRSNALVHGSIDISVVLMRLTVEVFFFFAFVCMACFSTLD